MENFNQINNNSEKMSLKERVNNIVSGLGDLGKGFVRPLVAGASFAALGNVDGTFSGLTPESIEAGGGTLFVMLLLAAPSLMKDNPFSKTGKGTFFQGFEKLKSAVTGNKLEMSK